MSAGRTVAALGWFVLFGVVAVLMSRSALHDWREGRRDRDAATLLLAIEQWWPATIAGLVAVAVPVVLILDP